MEPSSFTRSVNNKCFRNLTRLGLATLRLCAFALSTVFRVNQARRMKSSMRLNGKNDSLPNAALVMSDRSGKQEGDHAQGVHQLQPRLRETSRNGARSLRAIAGRRNQTPERCLERFVRSPAFPPTREAVREWNRPTPTG